MTPSPGRVFRALAAESVADATRRRIVPVIVVLALVSLLVVDSCTSCQPSFTRNGEIVELPSIAGWSGLLIVVLLGLWTLVLAGVVASDHLLETLSDGSASLTLSRPVSREAFALARLFGALSIGVGFGAVVLLATVALLAVRQDVTAGPALGAFVACAVSATTVAALSMAASLFLPRALTALLVFGGVAGMAALNAMVQFGVEIGGMAGIAERFGPPLATALVVPLAPWIAPTAVQGDPLELALRSLVWAVASTAALLWAFQRVELGS